ncbi:ABC transporter substrate-binding protein [Brucella endophytica]|uniref:ABC transporter substrate-binding protein n=2 Tax=Brucella endophytica TaxID=1963359 RepID=A0A916SGF2_9HYPH|nr:ABC transporter substrate-binding protein [Brucella endophytica]
MPRAACAASSPRIVSLDYGLSSTLLSLGVVPAAISDLADWGRWVIEPAMPASVIDLGNTMEVNVEILAQIRPDIILMTPYLDQLAPIVAPYGKVSRYEIFTPDSGAILTASIAATRKLGAEIGREMEAEAFLARADAFFGKCRERLARVSPPPVALVNFMDARHARIYGSPGLFHNVLERIGVMNAWKEPANYWGFQTISIEELARVTDPDAVLIAFDPVPGDVLPKLGRSPLWQALPFSRPGHFSILPPTLMFGMVNEAMRFAGLLTDLLERRA